MRVFVSPGPSALSPLEAAARDAWVLDRTLAETMARDLAAAGLEVVPVASLAEGEERARAEAEGGLVMLDSLLVSPTVIKRFVAAARARAGSVALVCALPRAVGTDALSPIDGLTAAAAPGGPVWTAPFYFVRGAGAIASAELALQPYRENVLRFAIPFGILGR